MHRLNDMLCYVMYTCKCYVHVPKCLPGSKVKYKQNPNERILNEVLMLEGTPYDTL